MCVCVCVCVCVRILSLVFGDCQFLAYEIPDKMNTNCLR